MDTAAVLFAIIILAWIAYNMCRAFYHLFDHSGWNEHSNPSTNAKILKVSTEKVQYVKNGMKYKTTILFSDGFYFITHKTNREDSFFSYRISIDEALRQKILDKAIEKHEKAVNKHYRNHHNNKSNKPTATNETQREVKAPNSQRSTDAYDDVTKVARSLAIATIEALQHFEKEETPEYLCRSVATKTDAIIFSHFYLRAICIMATEKRNMALNFSGKYVSYIYKALSKMNAVNPSFDSIYKDRVAFYDRVFASKQGIEKKTSALIEEFEYIIRTDILSGNLAPFSETSPLVVTGDIHADMMYTIEIGSFCKYLLSYTHNCVEQAIEAIR